ncbi:MAG: hypothetical protein AABX91_03160 [Nanoarchaeota archaeon]
MSTTIQISDNVKMTLEKMKLFSRESYNEILERMIEDEMELSAETKRELEERKKDKTFSHDEVRKILGL